MTVDALVTIVGIPLMLVVVAVKHRDYEHEWFKRIFLASDEKLSTRPVSDLTHDYQRLMNIETATGSLQVIPFTLAGYQRIRLEKVLDSMGRSPGV